VSPKQQRFIDEYLVDLNATQAAIRAGYSPRTAEKIGSENIRKPEIAAAIGAAQAERAQRTAITADRVLAETWALLTADPRELVELHVDACRHCYGKQHRYQRTEAEMARDRAAHEHVQKGRKSGAAVAPFDEGGGVGFDPRRTPVPSCTECHGRGVERVQLNDTRKLSPAAASLFAGVKQTRDGIEVKLHPKVEAIEKLFRHLGLYDRVKPGSESMARLATAKTITEKGRIVIDAAARGDLTVSQASQLLGGLGTLAKLIETTDLEARLAALEAARRN
jgi:phage terminase small subunit